MKRRAWLAAGAAVVLLAALAAFFHLRAPLQAAMGFVSHVVCSGVFVSGLDAEQVYAQALRPIAGLADLDPLIRYRVDKGRREVRASVGGIFERSASAIEGYGCLVEPTDGAPIARPAPRPRVISEGTPQVKNDPRLQPALERAFAEYDKPPYRRTVAVVVVKDGRIVAESYVPGYGVGTPILGYSLTKSVFSALAGILVRQGKLSISAPAPVPQWQGAGDARHAITLDMLIRMTSGLDILETNRDYDPVGRMIYMERDMAGFAERASLTSAPGTAWKYTSGNTMILARVLRDVIGGGPAGFLEFAHRELFGPLGMSTVTLEFDAAGTPVGSSYLHASARDWARFGMLYLEDGVVGGRRILPEGWVRYSASRTLESPYAAGFWVGSKTMRARWAWPEDAFFGAGVYGQRVMVIPSERLIVARFGYSFGAGYDFEGFARLVSDVREALARE